MQIVRRLPHAAGYLGPRLPGLQCRAAMTSGRADAGPGQPSRAASPWNGSCDRYWLRRGRCARARKAYSKSQAPDPGKRARVIARSHQQGPGFLLSYTRIRAVETLQHGPGEPFSKRAIFGVTDCRGPLPDRMREESVWASSPDWFAHGRSAASLPVRAPGALPRATRGCRAQHAEYRPRRASPVWPD
jgi:hypothetical protein